MSMSVEDTTSVFQRVAVVSLARRTDRWRSFLRRLPSDWPFAPPLRFPAVDGHAAEIPGYWKTGAGAWGCYQSHLAIIEDCLQRNIDSILILEDDAIFVRDFAAEARSFLQHLPADWQYLYFGGQHIELHLGLPAKVNDWVYRPFNVNRTHAYALRGHAMLECVHAHLQNPQRWKPDHQIDHHLGELHKSMESGLYVPRSWLVAQTEGPSDISEVEQPERIFWGAESLVYPRVQARIAVVLGGYDRETTAVAGAMQALGILFGAASETINASEPDTPQPHFENAWLEELCGQFFTGPWLQESVPSAHRVRLLRLWAAHRHDHRRCLENLVGAKHPFLCLLGNELTEAWNRPPVIAVEMNRDSVISAALARHARWPVDAVLAAVDQLHLARDLFLSRYNGPVLHVRQEDIHRRPNRLSEDLASFLHIRPERSALAAAERFIASVQDQLATRGNSALPPSAY
jgi:hypothetical protein